MSVLTVAQGSRSQLLAKKQTGIGVPAGGNYSIVRLNTHSINAVKEIIESQEIRSDREITDSRHGNRAARGSTTHELVYGHSSTDAFIESMMFSEFSAVSTDDAGIINIGVTPQYFTMEDGALDVGIYRPFYDMLVSRGQFVFGTGREAIVQATFDWVGLDGGNPSAASIGGTPAEVTVRQPFDTFSGALYDNNAETGEEMLNVTRAELTVDNTANPIYGFGQQTGIALEYGRARVTGQLSMYYTERSKQFIERFMREITAQLVINIVEDTRSMEFKMLTVKYNGSDVPLANERSRIITLPFVALRNNSIGTALRITKFST